MRALIGQYFMEKKWMVHRDGSGWRYCDFISTEKATFQREKCLAML